MANISTTHYLLDRARRRFTPTLNNIPGMGVLEKRVLAHPWKTKVLAKPPVGSDLKPVVGDSGLPLLGHSIEFFRGGPDFALHLYPTYGPVFFFDVRILRSVNVLGPDATQAVFSNKNKDFSQKGWYMRQTVRDTDLLGYHVPAGTNVLTWPGMNHRLPELRTEPDKFDPDRFAEPRAEHKKHRYAFAPFGGGAHKCIGLVFGQLEVKTVVHRLLRRYRLEVARPGYQPRWDYGGIPMPTDGMPIVLRPLG
jgi:hypothetical protein